MSYNVAVLGATGAVGHEMLTILEERNFPINNIYALASKRSVGKEVSFGDKVLNNHLLDMTVIIMHSLDFKKALDSFFNGFTNANEYSGGDWYPQFSSIFDCLQSSFW